VHAQEPNWFATAPVGAVNKALAKAGWAVKDVDLWEINEAFAEIRVLLQADKGDEAAEMVDGMIAGAKNPRVKQRLEQVRGQLDQVRLQMAIQGGGEKAAAAFSKLAEAQADSAEGLNALAWMIVTLAERGAPIDDALTAAATEAANSRLYGGIHYPFGNINGLEQGRCIGAFAAGLKTKS
jgi:hypothetical protein